MFPQSGIHHETRCLERPFYDQARSTVGPDAEAVLSLPAATRIVGCPVSPGAGQPSRVPANGGGGVSGPSATAAASVTPEAWPDDAAVGAASEPIRDATPTERMMREIRVDETGGLVMSVSSCVCVWRTNRKPQLRGCVRQTKNPQASKTDKMPNRHWRAPIDTIPHESTRRRTPQSTHAGEASAPGVCRDALPRDRF
jgi:hypothetical protein